MPDLNLPNNEGQLVPDVSFKVRRNGDWATVTSAQLFGGKNVIVFSLPGAFTPTCSMQHMPSYLQNMDALRAKGVDTVACLAVNDVFVMGAWAKEQGVDGRITMLADGAGAFTKALGLELDLVARGLGIEVDQQMIQSTSGIDVVLGGHNHIVLQRPKACSRTCSQGDQAAARSRSVSLWNVSAM